MIFLMTLGSILLMTWKRRRCSNRIPRNFGTWTLIFGLFYRLFNLNSEDPLSVDPENYIVEKRSNDVFIAYSAVKEGEESVTLDIRSINLTTGTVVEAQQYYFSPNDVTGEMDAKVVAEGETLWGRVQLISPEILPVPSTSSLNLQYGTAYDACIRSVDSLCAVGGGVGGDRLLASRNYRYWSVLLALVSSGLSLCLVVMVPKSGFAGVQGVKEPLVVI
ncbi:hypothetical protein QP028_12980 [Corynebacterium suedekumii]|nr:hypothetical protein QP028_12980 [Corynebacterium suedekumii]